MLNNPSYHTFSLDSEYCQSVQMASNILSRFLTRVGLTVLETWSFIGRLTTENPAIGLNLPRFGQSDVLPADVGHGFSAELLASQIKTAYVNINPSSQGLGRVVSMYPGLIGNRVCLNGSFQKLDQRSC